MVKLDNNNNEATYIPDSGGSLTCAEGSGQKKLRQSKAYHDAK